MFGRLRIQPKLFLWGYIRIWILLIEWHLVGRWFGWVLEIVVPIRQLIGQLVVGQLVGQLPKQLVVGQLVVGQLPKQLGLRQLRKQLFLGQQLVD